MRRPDHIAFAAGLAGLLLLAMPGPATAQEVSLTTHKSGYGLGEPVYVTVTVHNDTGAPLQIPAELDPAYGGSIIRVSGLDGEPQPFVPLAFFEHDEPPRALRPGERAAEVVAVFYGRDGWTFRETGGYELTASVSVRNGGESRRVRSEPLSIEVTSATTRSRQLVAGDEASEQAGRFLLWLSGDHLSEGIRLLDSVAGTQPGSGLASHIEFAFGWSKSRAFSNYLSGEVREPDNEAALAHLSQARDGHLPPRLRLQKRLAQAACYIRLGDRRQAEASLAEAAEIMEANPALLALSEQLERLRNAAGYQPAS